MLFTDGKLRDLKKFMCLPKYPTLKGGGRYKITYHYTRNDEHRTLFFNSIESKYKTNNAFVSIVYLMTADIFCGNRFV